VPHEIPDRDMGGCGLSRCEWVGGLFHFLLASKNLPIQPMVPTLVGITCPIAIIGSHYPVSLYLALAANVATYALVGLVVETLRRQLNHSN
jgi:hypothetical protein